MASAAAPLLALFETPPEGRNDTWRDRLSAAFWPTRLATFEPHYVTNDLTGMHAFRFGGPGETAPAEVVDYAIRETMGLVLWPSDAPAPLWAFDHGAVLSYRLYGTAYAPRFWDEPEDQGGYETVQDAEEALVGAPNEEMFPSLVRDAVRRVMREGLGIAEPKVLLLGRPGRGTRLVFGLDPETLGGDAAAARAFAMVGGCVPSCIPLYRIDGFARDEAMRPF